MRVISSVTLSLVVAVVVFLCSSRSCKADYDNEEVSKLLEFCENQATDVEDYFVDYLTVCTCKVGELQQQEEENPTTVTNRADNDNESSSNVAAIMKCMDGCQACMDMGNNITYCAYRDMEATIIVSTETTTGFRIVESCHLTSRDVATQQRMCSSIDLEHSGTFLDALETAMANMPKLIIQCPPDEGEEEDKDQMVVVEEEEQTKEPFSYADGNDDDDDDDDDNDADDNSIIVDDDDGCKQQLVFDMTLVLFRSSILFVGVLLLAVEEVL